MFIFGSASEYDLALQFIELSRRYFFNSSELNLSLKKVFFFWQSYVSFGLCSRAYVFLLSYEVLYYFFQGEQTLALFPPFCFFFVLFCFLFVCFFFCLFNTRWFFVFVLLVKLVFFLWLAKKSPHPEAHRLLSHSIIQNFDKQNAQIRIKHDNSQNIHLFNKFC